MRAHESESEFQAKREREFELLTTPDSSLFGPDFAQPCKVSGFYATL